MHDMKVTLSVDVPNLGARLREARIASGRTPTQIAAQADMSTANLYRIESEDTKSIPRETLQRLSVALGYDFDAEVKALLLAIAQSVD